MKLQVISLSSKIGEKEVCANTFFHKYTNRTFQQLNEIKLLSHFIWLEKHTHTQEKEEEKEAVKKKSIHPCIRKEL